MRRRPLILMSEPDTHTSNNNVIDMDDPELSVEQESLLYPNESSMQQSSNKKDKGPGKMLTSYRGRRRLVVMAIAVAATLSVVIKWGPGQREETEGM